MGSDIVACPYAAALPKLIESLLALTTNRDAEIVIAYQGRLKDEDIFFDLAKEHFTLPWLPRRALHRDYNNERARGRSGHSAW